DRLRVARRLQDHVILGGQRGGKAAQRLRGGGEPPRTPTPAPLNHGHFRTGPMDISANVAHGLTSLTVRPHPAEHVVGNTTPTDSRSQRIPVSRKGRPHTNARSQRTREGGLPSLRVPSAPVRDGRTILRCRSARKDEEARSIFIPDTNLPEGF